MKLLDKKYSNNNGLKHKMILTFIYQATQQQIFNNKNNLVGSFNKFTRFCPVLYIIVLKNFTTNLMLAAFLFLNQHEEHLNRHIVLGNPFDKKLKNLKEFTVI